jgi:hypothetical protein
MLTTPSRRTTPEPLRPWFCARSARCPTGCTTQPLASHYAKLHSIIALQRTPSTTAASVVALGGVLGGDFQEERVGGARRIRRALARTSTSLVRAVNCTGRRPKVPCNESAISPTYHREQVLHSSLLLSKYLLARFAAISSANGFFLAATAHDHRGYGRDEKANLGDYAVLDRWNTRDSLPSIPKNSRSTRATFPVLQFLFP